MIQTRFSQAHGGEGGGRDYHRRLSAARELMDRMEEGKQIIHTLGGAFPE